MRGLLYKELYLLRKDFLFCFGYVLAIVIILGITSGIAFWFSDLGGFPNPSVSVIMILIEMFIVIYFCLAMFRKVIKTDTGREWGYYSVTIPGSEKKSVAVKYMVLFIAYFISFVLCKLADIFAGLITGEAIDLSAVILAIIFFQIFFSAIELPLGYRFGTDKGEGIKICLFLAIALIICIYLLFGNIEWLMGENGIVKEVMKAAEANQNVGDAIYNEFKGMIERMQLWGIIVSSCLPHAAVICYYISYRISCKVYKKGVTRVDC